MYWEGSCNALIGRVTLPRSTHYIQRLAQGRFLETGYSGASVGRVQKYRRQRDNKLLSLLDNMLTDMIIIFSINIGYSMIAVPQHSPSLHMY